MPMPPFKDDLPHRIADAFVAIVEQESYAKASVSRLCAELEISRQTFYRHFPNKFSVLAYVFLGDLARELFAQCPESELVYPTVDLQPDREHPAMPVYARAPLVNSFMDQSKFISSLIQAMQRHRGYYLKLLDPRKEGVFVEYFKQLYTPLLAEDIRLILGDRYLPKKLIAYLAEYHTTGMIAMLPMQVADNDRFSLDGDLNPLLNLTHESIYAAIERHHASQPPEEESPFYALEHR